MTKKKEPYFPNNWKALKDAPAEAFDSIEFDEFMDWKISGWEIPSSVACVIRVHNYRTNKVTEHIYNTLSAGERKARELMLKGESEFVVYTKDQVTQMIPQHWEDDDHDEN